MIILGIDPGTATVGYGLVECNDKGNNAKHLSHGTITTSPDLEQPMRLQRIYKDLAKLIREWEPQCMAVENVYFFKNVKTAFPVSQAKGVILLAAAQKKLPVYEVTPLQVKTAITGYGKAEKKQMQHMVKELLALEDIPRPDDAADALGVAISCSLLYKAELQKKTLGG